MGGVPWIDIAGLLSIPLSATAAYIAWLNYQRKPKLHFYVGDPANEIKYSDEYPGLAYVHATLDNTGKVAASNVHGRVEFEPGRVFPVKRRPANLTNKRVDENIVVATDNWATLQFGTLAVSRPRAAEGTLHARSFENSPRHFIIPVRVTEVGPTRFSYWFVSDETKGIEGTATLNFPELTTTS